MTEVDFAVAFFLVIVIFVYCAIYVSNVLSSDFNKFNSKKLEKSASSISSQLFSVRDNKSLVSEFKLIQVSFKEIGGNPHVNTLEIEITPVVNKVHVYDRMFNEIDSIVTTSDKTKVSFSLSFSSNEKKYANIVYEGNHTTNIEYVSDETETNVTSTLISEKEIYVLSKNICSKLQSLDYDSSRSLFGFTENFRIANGCVYGMEPPFDANLIVRTVPLLVEKDDGGMQSEEIKLMVW